MPSVKHVMRTPRATTSPATLSEELVRSERSSEHSDVLRMQSTHGNQATIRRMANQTIQRQDPPAGAPQAAAPAPAATPVAETPVEETYPDIEALNLNATAKAAAIALKKKFPKVVFTSGTRDWHDQARAMASNVVSSKNRNWVKDTYSSNATSNAIQKWIDDNPKSTTVEDITAGIESVMEPMTDAQRGLISKHLGGAAFDVQPVTEDAEAIKKAMAELEGATKFLEKEGGLVRWHVQF